MSCSSSSCHQRLSVSFSLHGAQAGRHAVLRDNEHSDQCPIPTKDIQLKTVHGVCGSDTLTQMCRRFHCWRHQSERSLFMNKQKTVAINTPRTQTGGKPRDASGRCGRIDWFLCVCFLTTEVWEQRTEDGVSTQRDDHSGHITVSASMPSEAPENQHDSFQVT